MRIRLEYPSSYTEGEIAITGSKSESNRLLILQALFPEIIIKNILIVKFVMSGFFYCIRFYRYG